MATCSSPAEAPGGFNVTNTSEIYDPTTNSWSAAAPLPLAREYAVAAPVGSGQVLVTSGMLAPFNDTADSEIYTPLVTVDPTSTAVTCDPSSVVDGQSTTCTATVTDTGSTPSNPTGTVTFTANRPNWGVNGSPCTLTSVPGSSSESSCSVTFTAGVGTATVTGSYGADTTHTTSSGQATVKVTPRTTKTTLNCTPSVAVGTAGSCTATVTDTSSAGQPIIPTGTVSFTGNASDQFNPSSCGLSPVDGSSNSASCTVDYVPQKGPNHHTLSAHYKGDTIHTGSTGTTTVNVTPAPPI